MRGSYSSKGTDVGGNLVAPAGLYTLKIKKVYDTDKEGNPKVSGKGDPMVSVLCEINEGEFLGSTLWHNVTFMGKDETGKPKKGAGMAVHFLKVIGQPWEDDFEYDSDNWPGKVFRANLKVTTFNGNVRNEIGYLVDPEKPESDDTVPF